MLSHRYWLAGLIAVMFLMIGIAMMSASINIHPWALSLMGMLAVFGLLVPYRYTHWFAGTTVLAYAVLLAVSGPSDSPFWLLETVIEFFGITLAGTLVYQVGYHLKQFEDALLQILMLRRGLNVNSQQAVQEEMEREIRRARRYERPLSLVSIEPEYPTSKIELHRYLEEMTSRLGRQLIKGRIAELFATQTKANDIVSYHNGKFLVLLPETDKSQAEAMASRLSKLCEDSLSLTAQTGTASFPCEELTLSGLVKRTVSPSEKELQVACELQEKVMEDFVLQETV